MDFPGISVDEVDIELAGNMFRVSGEHKEEKEEKDKREAADSQNGCASFGDDSLFYSMDLLCAEAFFCANFLAMKIVLPTQILPERKTGMGAPTQASTRPSPAARDWDAADALRRALQRAGYLSLESIRVEVGETKVRLSGVVPSFYLKQVAQTAAMLVIGERTLQNDLHVPRVPGEH